MAGFLQMSASQASRHVTAIAQPTLLLLFILLGALKAPCQDLGRAQLFQKQLEEGMVGVLRPGRRQRVFKLHFRGCRMRRNCALVTSKTRTFFRGNNNDSFLSQSDLMGANVGTPSSPPPAVPSKLPCPDNAHASRFFIEPYPVRGPVPWEHLSTFAQADFTLDHKVPSSVMYMEDSDSHEARKWSREEIDQMIAWIGNGQQEVSSYHAVTDVMFRDALKEYPVKDLTVLVIGSQLPWVEAYCLHGGAAAVTTVDFNPPVVDYPKLKTIQISELDSTEETFDVAFSFSSLEHDGLGRYGDPLNPWGDLQRMKKIQGLIKPTGKLFLGVPMGPDSLVFNAHRIFGPIRFPMLIKGWKLVKTYGASLEQAYARPMNEYEFQPLHVLQLEAAASG